MNIPIANVVSRRIQSRIWRRSFAYKCTDVSCMLINLLRGDPLLSRAISDHIFINLPCSKVTLRWYIIYTYSLLKLSDPHVILVYTIILWTLINFTHVCIYITAFRLMIENGSYIHCRKNRDYNNNVCKNIYRRTFKKLVLEIII